MLVAALNSKNWNSKFFLQIANGLTSKAFLPSYQFMLWPKLIGNFYHEVNKKLPASMTIEIVELASKKMTTNSS